MSKLKQIYYSDELNDDFANNNIKQVKLEDDFKYINNNIFYKIITFIFYRLIVTPLVWCYVKIKYHQKFINKKALRKVKGSYFLYGNHTNGDLDAFVPSLLTFPKKSYIIVNPDATSIKGIRTIVMMLGAIPLPNGMKLYRKYLEAISSRISNKNNVVVIYPEAHIWPYYTDVRDFNKASLSYPVENNKPVFCFTNIYKKRKLFKRPKVRTYIDGPFYPDNTLTKKENINMLKEKAYNAMKGHVLDNPKYVYKYDYIKVNKEGE